MPLSTNSGLIEWVPQSDTLHALVHRLSAAPTAISAGRQRRRAVPSDLLFGRSALTRLLHPALGGGCRTTLVVTLSPADHARQDALRALPHDAERFASDARLREAGYRPADEVWPGRRGEPSGLREEL